jgi:hypothetical protein
MFEHTIKHNAAPKGSSDRSFGFVFTAVFLLVAVYPILYDAAVRKWAIGLACFLFGIALFAPKLLAPANKLWTKFGFLLHTLISPVALGFVFYFAVLPTGLLLRLLGKDPLRLRIDPNAKSYWINREPPGPEAESLNNQF